MDYEGQSAYLQPKSSLSKTLKSRKGRVVRLRSRENSAMLSSEASADDGSEDDYVDESANKRRGPGKVSVLTMSVAIESHCIRVKAHFSSPFFLGRIRWRCR